jgi:hypothetical protein
MLLFLLFVIYLDSIKLIDEHAAFIYRIYIIIYIIHFTILLREKKKKRELIRHNRFDFDGNNDAIINLLISIYKLSNNISFFILISSQPPSSSSSSSSSI